MVDKLFLRRELFVLRCSFRNLPTLCPILIGSLFYVVFYTRDGLVFSLAHGYRSVRPVCPGSLGLVALITALIKNFQTTFSKFVSPNVKHINKFISFGMCEIFQIRGTINNKLDHETLCCNLVVREKLKNKV